MKFILKVLNKIGVLGFLNFRTRKRIWGEFRTIPILGGVGLDNYLYPSEPWLYQLLTNLEESEPKGGYFLDVGVNIGQTLMKVKSQKRNIPYIGFEPNPECIHYLNELFLVNDFGHVELYPIGVGDKTGVRQLYFFHESSVDSSASILSDFRDADLVLRSSNIPVFLIEDLEMSELDVNYLKIDVEGAELEVLISFQKMVSICKPLIFIEILPAYTAENTFRINRQQEIENFVIANNYEIFRVIKNDEDFDFLEPVSSFDVHSNLVWCDYLLIPAKERKRLEKLMSSRK